MLIVIFICVDVIILFCIFHIYKFVHDDFNFICYARETDLWCLLENDELVLAIFLHAMVVA